MWEALAVVAHFRPDSQLGSLPSFKLLSAFLSYKVTELIKEGRDLLIIRGTSDPCPPWQDS